MQHIQHTYKHPESSMLLFEVDCILQTFSNRFDVLFSNFEIPIDTFNGVCILRSILYLNGEVLFDDNCNCFTFKF